MKRIALTVLVAAALTGCAAAPKYDDCMDATTVMDQRGVVGETEIPVTLCVRVDIYYDAPPADQVIPAEPQGPRL